jgi:hypothetical protein
MPCPSHPPWQDKHNVQNYVWDTECSRPSLLKLRSSKMRHRAVWQMGANILEEPRLNTLALRYRSKTLAWRCSVWKSPEIPAILNEGFCGFPQPLQANAAIYPQLGHDRFLPNPFQFISYRPMLYTLGWPVKLLMAFASTVILGFRPRRDLWPRFLLSPRHVCLEMRPTLRRGKGSVFLF